MTKSTIDLLKRLLAAELRRHAFGAGCYDKGSRAEFAVRAVLARQACQKAMKELEDIEQDYAKGRSVKPLLLDTFCGAGGCAIKKITYSASCVKRATGSITLHKYWAYVKNSERHS